MNPEQLLNAVAEAIKTRDRENIGRFYLYAREGNIVCVPADPTPAGSITLGVFSNDELNKGFTNKQWAGILQKLAKVIKGQDE